LFAAPVGAAAASSLVIAEVLFFDRPSASGGDTEAKQVLRNERVGALKETIGALTGAWYYPLTSLPLETNGATPLSAVISLRHSASPCSDITATHA
jgi:hypothetical protein